MFLFFSTETTPRYEIGILYNRILAIKFIPYEIPRLILFRKKFDH